MIQVAVVILRRLREGDGAAMANVPPALVWLVRITFVVGWVVLYLGTIVTGSGPHAGDLDSPRNGLDPAALSQLHTDAVFLLLGLTIGSLCALRAVEAPLRAVRAAQLLLGLELAQGLVGFVQYFSGLPIVLVGLHLLGSAAVAAALAWLLVGVRDRATAGAAPVS
jgi:cytochrome c oxidase assembly protein subunit 15